MGGGIFLFPRVPQLLMATYVSHGVLARTPRKVQQGIFEEILRILLLDRANIIASNTDEMGVRKTLLKMAFWVEENQWFEDGGFEVR